MASSRPLSDSDRDAQHAELRAKLRRARVRYRSIFENAIDGIFQTTATGHYISANPALARIYGYESPADLIASLTDIEHDLYVDPTRRSDFIRLLHEHDTVTGFESQVRRRDGRVIWIMENARAVREENGELLYYEGTVADITARKETEEALQRSRRELEEEARTSAALVRVGHEIISVLDTPTMVDRICRLTTEMLRCDCSHTLLWDAEANGYRVVGAHGYPQEQIDSMHLLLLPATTVGGLVEDVRGRDVAHFAHVGEGNCPSTELASMVGLTSGMHAALRRGDEIVGIHGAGFRGPTDSFNPSHQRILAGISQLTSLALENSRLVEKLEHASRLKSDFVATMSHELRTPLNVILGYSEILLDQNFGPLLPGQRNALERLDMNGRQLLELINTTLDLGRLDADRLAVELCEVDLHSLFAEIEGETQSLRLASRLRFHWQVDPQLPALHTDRAKLKVILKNLVSNAVKFTPSGEVAVSASFDDEGTTIEVRDTGAGIAKETLPIIFEAFRQGDSSPTRRFDGAGLGLYIVRRLLELLGGTVNVHSELGKGSTFRVVLPFIRP